MNDRTLLKDFGIILGIALVGVIIYFAFPAIKGAVPSLNSKDVQSANTETLKENSNSMPTDNSQLKIEVLKEGSGPGAAKGQTVSVDYTGKLTDGKVFDSSIPRGQPFTLTLGENQVIPGWEMGLLGMKVGEQRRLTIPPALAYGPSGIGGVIPPNATLVFDVEMKSIK